jgi:hypothetical protein
MCNGKTLEKPRKILIKIFSNNKGLRKSKFLFFAAAKTVFCFGYVIKKGSKKILTLTYLSPPGLHNRPGAVQTYKL